MASPAAFLRSQRLAEPLPELPAIGSADARATAVLQDELELTMGDSLELRHLHVKKNEITYLVFYDVDGSLSIAGFEHSSYWVSFRNRSIRRWRAGASSSATRTRMALTRGAIIGFLSCPSQW